MGKWVMDADELDEDLYKRIKAEFDRLRKKHPDWKAARLSRKVGEALGINLVMEKPSAQVEVPKDDIIVPSYKKKS